MQCKHNSFIQIINFHGLFRNALRCLKTGACQILVPIRYMHYSNFNGIIIIVAFIIRTYPSSEDVQGAKFPLPREHSLPSCLSWRYRQIHTQYILHILPGTHLYTWVESSNVDKVSCWRTKVPGINGNRTHNPLIQSQGFTPIYHGTFILVMKWRFHSLIKNVVLFNTLWSWDKKRTVQTIFRFSYLHVFTY